MKKTVNKPFIMMFTVIALVFTLTGSAFAFNDIDDDPEKAAITQLSREGVISGVGHNQFAPKGKLTIGNAIALIVKGMDLGIDVSEMPKASDYFTNVKDDAWYAQAFVVAHHNGLDIPQDIDPNADINREQYAHWLYQALEKHGDYAWIELHVMMSDEDQVNPDYMISIQRLLIGKIAKLNDDSEFRPKQAITRSEAAGMLHRAMQFVKNNKPIEEPESVLKDVQLSVENVTDEIAKVTLTAQAPHPGYGIEVSSIVFHDDQAIINYRAKLPDPDMMYPQVITGVKVDTYIAATYTPSLGSEEFSFEITPDQPVSSEAAGGSVSGHQGAANAAE